MLKYLKLFVAFLILFSGGTVRAQEREAQEYRISAHDLLEISVYDEKELSKAVRVSPDGSITYPLIGSLSVAGLTARELEAKLIELFEKDYLVNPQITVFIKEYSKVYVLGQVRNPGAYELRSGLTVIGAIALAGGLTDIAEGNATKVIRQRDDKKEVIQVPVDSILKGGNKTQDVVLEANDTVMVPEASF